MNDYVSGLLLFQLYGIGCFVVGLLIGGIL